MSIFLGLIILSITFIIMEGVTWCTHKYVMHGFLWYLHEDHHAPYPEHFFEKNDAFFFVFAIPSWLLTMFGVIDGWDFKFYIGLGIAAYGIAYFLVHDVFIHQRFKWFSRTDNAYFRAIRKGHKVHHKNTGKEESQVFGMLFVPFRYFKEAFNSKK